MTDTTAERAAAATAELRRRAAAGDRNAAALLAALRMTVKGGDALAGGRAALDRRAARVVAVARDGVDAFLDRDEDTRYHG